MLRSWGDGPKCGVSCETQVPKATCHQGSYKVSGFRVLGFTVKGYGPP